METTRPYPAMMHLMRRGKNQPRHSDGRWSHSRHSPTAPIAEDDDSLMNIYRLETLREEIEAATGEPAKGLSPLETVRLAARLRSVQGADGCDLAALAAAEDDAKSLACSLPSSIDLAKSLAEEHDAKSAVLAAVTAGRAPAIA